MLPLQSGLTDTKKRLALSIIDFLQASLKDGTLSSDDAESVEIATSCISESFKVNPSDTAAMTSATQPQTLYNVFNVYEKLKGKSTASTAGDGFVNEGRPSTPSTPAREKPPPPMSGATASGAAGPVPNPEAEKLKSAGNAAMAQKDYATAIDKYTEAVSMSPSNPIYLSNRAAAYSASGRHAEAAADAEIAVAADPKYTKAWSRLGLAKFALGDARGAMEAYQMGIENEGGSGSEAMRKGLETAKKRVEEMEKEEATLPEDAPDDAATTGRAPTGGMPDLSSLAGMFGGGGRGGGGGMPDLGSIMSNPMFAGMARNLMQNPDALSGLMSNPRIQQMMEGMQGGGGRGGGAGGAGAGAGAGAGGGGMPDLGSLMQDPSIAAL